jgi:DNA helicase-2/ATP-dependent DNA helicase PcrA
MRVKKLFGPPGTGKTTALLNELEKEIGAGVQPERIAFMSFTVAARREAIDRVVKKFAFERDRLIHFRTVHSACFRQMGIPRSAIVSPDKLKLFAEKYNIEFSAAALGNPEEDTPVANMLASIRTKGDAMMAFDHLRRHRFQSLTSAFLVTDKLFGVRPVDLSHFTKAYAEWKQSEGLHDFTDMLQRVERPLDVDVLFIDEAQDLSKLQWWAAKTLGQGALRAYVAGDDDQAIFQWAGAEPEAFLSMPADDEVVLGRSYRVPRRVHRVAAAVVGHIGHRKDKRWAARDELGTVGFETEVRHWEPRDDGTTFILARNNYLLLRYELHLRELGVPYHRQGSRDESSISRWREPVLLWERQRRGKILNDEERQVVEKHQLTPGAVSTDQEWFFALDRIPEREALYLRAVLRRYGNDGLVKPPLVSLSTIHAVKGMEADHVVMEAGMSPSSKKELHTNSDSEARVIYVGVTRARESFTLVGGTHPMIPVELLSNT